MDSCGFRMRSDLADLVEHLLGNVIRAGCPPHLDVEGLEFEVD